MRALVVIAVGAVAAGLAAPGARSEPPSSSRATPELLARLEARPERVEGLARALSDLHPMDPRVVASLDDEALRALAVLARDRDRPLAIRARALALLGARPGPLADAVFAEARRDPEREVRVQAAWSQGLALGGRPGSLAFVRSLLDDVEPHLREVGAQLLFRLHPDAAPAIARAHLERERDPVVRALLERRLR